MEFFQVTIGDLVQIAALLVFGLSLYVALAQRVSALEAKVDLLIRVAVGAGAGVGATGGKSNPEVDDNDTAHRRS